MILVSACLLGVPCRYDGAARPLLDFPEHMRGRALLPVCPEELGGLGTPRPPAEISSGDGQSVLDGKARVLRGDGSDVTAEFVSGARKVLCLARDHKIKAALMKSRSPSCGAGTTHACGRVVEGDGVCAALLRREGIEILELG